MIENRNSKTSPVASLATTLLFFIFLSHKMGNYSPSFRAVVIWNVHRVQPNYKKEPVLVMHSEMPRMLSIAFTFSRNAYAAVAAATGSILKCLPSH